MISLLTALQGSNVIMVDDELTSNYTISSEHVEIFLNGDGRNHEDVEAIFEMDSVKNAKYSAKFLYWRLPDEHGIEYTIRCYNLVPFEE